MATKRNRKLKVNRDTRDKKGKGSDGPSIRRFLIIYIILMSVFFVIYLFKPIVEIIDIGKVYNHFVVVALSRMLDMVGFSNTYQGSLVILPTLALDVKFGCNGLEAVMIYSIAVMAYPASRKKKLVGIAAGLFIIQIANFLRMIALVYSGIHFKNLFNVIHIYVAQGVMIALALGLFFVYLNYAEKVETAHT